MKLSEEQLKELDRRVGELIMYFSGDWYNVPMDKVQRFVRNELLDQCDAVEAQNGGWISVSERLPEYGVDVLTSNKSFNGKRVIREDHMTRFSGSWPDTHPCWQHGDHWFFNDREGWVTHWQPLPAAPVEHPKVEPDGASNDPARP